MSEAEALHRLSVAEEFRDTSRREYEQQEWSTCVGQAQMAVENAAKSVFAYGGPVPHTHEPEHELSQFLHENAGIPPEVAAHFFALMVYCRHMGNRVHAMATYGDERLLLKPSQLWHEPEANLAVSYATRACISARAIIDYFKSQEESAPTP